MLNVVAQDPPPADPAAAAPAAAAPAAAAETATTTTKGLPESVYGCVALISFLISIL